MIREQGWTVLKRKHTLEPRHRYSYLVNNFRDQLSLSTTHIVIECSNQRRHWQYSNLCYLNWNNGWISKANYRISEYNVTPKKQSPVIKFMKKYIFQKFENQSLKNQIITQITSWQVHITIPKTPISLNWSWITGCTASTRSIATTNGFVWMNINANENSIFKLRVRVFKIPNSVTYFVLFLPYSLRSRRSRDSKNVWVVQWTLHENSTLPLKMSVWRKPQNVMPILAWSFQHCLIYQYKLSGIELG